MQQIARSFALPFNHLPRFHHVMLGSLTIVTLTVAVWRSYIYSPLVEEPTSCTSLRWKTINYMN